MHLALHPSGDAQLLGLAADVRDELLLDQSDSVLARRLDRDLADLRTMPWHRWTLDRQIDFRMLYAQATTLRHMLATKMTAQRAANWLSGRIWLRNEIATHKLDGDTSALDNAIVAHARNALALVPANRFDAIELRFALSRARAACTGLRASDRTCRALPDGAENPAAAPTFPFIGRVDYDWRLRHQYLVPWTAAQISAMATQELARVEAQLAHAHPATAPVACDASGFDPAAAMHQAIGSWITAIRAANVVTIPRDVGGIAVEGRGQYGDLMSNHGEITPIASFGAATTARWVIAFPTQPQDICGFKWATENYQASPLNCAMAHELVPGHQLQGRIARNNRNTLRRFFVADDFAGEGWALYSESLALRSGALGSSEAARYYVLEAWRRRILRVFYDIRLQDGTWTLAQAQAYRRAHHGEADLAGWADELWYAQAQPLGLIRYFTGKMQLDALHEAYQRKMGARFSERQFNDAVLAEGFVPIALIRAKLLGEPIPDL